MDQKTVEKREGCVCEWLLGGRNIFPEIKASTEDGERKEGGKVQRILH